MIDALFLSLLLGAQPPAPDDSAKQLFKSGAAAFEAQDYRTALADFEQAYEVSQLDKLLYDIAQCHRELAQWSEAKDAYERYLVAVPDGKNHDAALRHLAEIQAELEAEVPRAPPAPAPTRVLSPEPTMESPPLLAAGQPIARPIPRPVPEGAWWLGGSGLALAIAGGLAWGLDAATAPPYAVSSVRGRDNAIGYGGQIAVGVGLGAAVAGAIWALTAPKHAP